MSKYVDCKSVLSLVNAHKRENISDGISYERGWNEALEQIESNITEDIQTADVAPVVSGHWIGSEDRIVRCSACNSEYYQDNLEEISEENDFVHYCPNCGANMMRR